MTDGGNRPVRPPLGQTIRVWAEPINNIIQAIALIVAGIWGYFVFVQTEAPNLELNASATTNLNWYGPTTPGHCEARLNVVLENIGQTPFTITNFTVRIWKFDSVPNPDAEISYIDLSAIQEGSPLFEQTYTAADNDPLFNRRYVPNEAFSNTFAWSVDADPAQTMYFRIDFYLENETTSRWHAGSWGPVCNF